MAAAEVQLSLSQSDRSTLDTVLKPHLRLEPQRTTREQKEEEEEEIMSPGKTPNPAIIRILTAYTLLEMACYYSTTMCQYWDMSVK